MTIPKPKKLPSGNWCIQIMVNGKRYSITDKDPKVCKQKAKELYAGIDVETTIAPLTVGDAIDRYIETQTGTLSPIDNWCLQTISKELSADSHAVPSERPQLRSCPSSN